MSENTHHLLAAIRLLAIGNALWVVPGLLPYDLGVPGWDWMRSGVNSVFSLAALVFMVRAALMASPARENEEASDE